MLKTLGLRHVALNVRDIKVSKNFYVEVMRMQVEWEPDTGSVYLTNQGMDNLALHQTTNTSLQATGKAQGFLDHMGFILPTPVDVDEWYEHIKKHQAEIVKEIKTHRDGARSFYFKDPDGVVIQMIYHPPISDKKS